MPGTPVILPATLRRRYRLAPLIFSFAILIASIACGVEPVGSESAVTGVVPEVVELAETRVIVTSSQGDQILYAKGWTFDGPDQADTVAFSIGTPDLFKMVTIQPIELSSPDETLNSFSQKARDDLQTKPRSRSRRPTWEEPSTLTTVAEQLGAKLDSGTVSREVQWASRTGTVSASGPAPWRPRPPRPPLLSALRFLSIWTPTRPQSAPEDRPSCPAKQAG